MRALLAERLLAQVMGWDPGDVARERPILQAFADLKYDAYQQFSPGMRFVESLALWLAQFKTIEERQTAYDFVKRQLIFFSHEEMAHFAAIVFPDFIRPLLINRAATAQNMPCYHVEPVVGTEEFNAFQPATLFFGLSDGARIDLFRRSNRDLTHEQIFQSYDLPPLKIEDLGKRLKQTEGQPLVRALVLLDDFTASGTSYFRKENGVFTGKIARFLNHISDDDPWKALVRLPDTLIIVALYVATVAALQRIREAAKECLGENASSFFVTAVQILPDDLCLTPGCADPFASLVENYYDPSLEDEHTQKGGTDLKYGFAGGGLPVVLHHNSPNNSLFLLWAEERSEVRSLFPRISRHKGDV